MINNDAQDAKSRNWFILIYEDSVNPDYINILKQMGIMCAISPCHDKDVNDKGEPLKPHRHILITFPNGSVRVGVINNIIQAINAYPHCETVRNKAIAHRYLYHGEE